MLFPYALTLHHSFCMMLGFFPSFAFALNSTFLLSCVFSIPHFHQTFFLWFSLFFDFVFKVTFFSLLFAILLWIVIFLRAINVAHRKKVMPEVKWNQKNGGGDDDDEDKSGTEVEVKVKNRKCAK